MSPDTLNPLVHVNCYYSAAPINDQDFVCFIKF